MDSHQPADTTASTGRRAALKKLGAGATALWVAPAITTGASAGVVASPAPGTCVSTEAELVAALAAATPRSTIVLCATTIPVASEIVLTEDVTLVSEGPGLATLSGSGTRLLRVDAGATVTLNGITITGRGIANSGALTLLNCIVDGAASDDSAVRSNGVLAATGTDFRNNATTGNGGAIWTSGGTLTATACTFIGNSALGDGGAVYLRDTTATFTNGVFQANAAARDGGAILAVGSSAFSTPLCSFVGNNADPALGAGGAVCHVASGTYTVGATTFTGNLAGIGTAIYRGTNPISLAGATFGPGQTVVNP